MIDGPDHIVVGVDGSPHGLAAARWASRRGVPPPGRRGARLLPPRPLHGGDERSYHRLPDTRGHDGPVDTSPRRHAVDARTGRRRRTRQGVPGSDGVLEGPPGPVLVTESKGASMLVVGRRGHVPWFGSCSGPSADTSCCTRHVRSWCWERRTERWSTTSSPGGRRDNDHWAAGVVHAVVAARAERRRRERAWPRDPTTRTSPERAHPTSVRPGWPSTASSWTVRGRSRAQASASLVRRRRSATARALLSGPAG